MLEKEESLGTVEKGKVADIIATECDPLENIDCMEKVVFVMKNGIVYKNKTIKN